MKKSLPRFILIGITLFSFSVIAGTSAQEVNCIPKKYEMALRYQQKSAEILALQLQTYKFATEKFKQKIRNIKNPEKLAIVMDLDETVIDNTQLLVRDLEQCHDYTKWDTWGDWEKTGNPKLIPGAKEFLMYANSKKINIYYVSDRTNENKKQTLNTLKTLGLPQASESNVLLDTDSKEVRRQLISKKHKIIMLFGDSLADLSAQFKIKKSTEEQRKLVEKNKDKFGEEWIVLPNASYGTWSSAPLDTWSK